jgi:hypothetical protein
MEHPSPPLFPTTRLQCLTTPHWADHGNAHHLPDLCHWARNRHGVHHQEDSGLWIPGADEPAPNRYVAENEVGQGKAGAEQRVFLVLDDLRAEHDVLAVCTLLTGCGYGW